MTPGQEGFPTPSDLQPEGDLAGGAGKPLSPNSVSGSPDQVEVPRPRPPRTARSPWILFLLLVFAFGYTHQRKYDSPTPMSRLALLRAIVEDGSVCIDRNHLLTPDKAMLDGHYYSDKAPGTAALALGPYLVGTHGMQTFGVPIDSKPGRLFSSWFACFWALGVPAALGATALFSWLRRFVTERIALLTTLACFLGAAPLPYTTMLFNHSLVVALLCLAIWSKGLLHDARLGRGRVFLAGLCLGLALACEYTAGIVVVALFLFMIQRSPHLKHLAFGFVLPLLLIPLYSWACFGYPILLPYSLHSTYPEMHTGLFGIKYPDLETLYFLLASPTRGLFFWSPFLLIAYLGFYELVQRRPSRLWLLGGIPLLHVLIISGYRWDWQAGPTVGPRFLSSLIALLALPCALGCQRCPRLGFALALYSIAITSVATLTDACPSYSLYNPLFDWNVPMLLRGELSPNLGTVLGLNPYASVALYYGILLGGFFWLWLKLAGSVQKKNTKGQTNY